MRSPRAFVAAAVIVLSYPLALAVQAIFGAGADTVIHLVTGTGFIIFASSVFTFALPLWINIVGAAAAGAFGAIFVLQGIGDLTHLEPLRYVAYDILGQQLERLLPDVVYLWFVALLLGDSRGWSRIVGWIVMVIVVGVELAAWISLLVGAPMASVIVLVLLPFLWLLMESARKPASPDAAPPKHTRRASAA